MKIIIRHVLNENISLRTKIMRTYTAQERLRKKI